MTAPKALAREIAKLKPARIVEMKPARMNVRLTALSEQYGCTIWCGRDLDGRCDDPKEQDASSHV